MPGGPGRRPVRHLLVLGVTTTALVVVAVAVSLAGSIGMAVTLGVLCILAVIAVVVLWQVLPPSGD
ncbi:hypothetical protein [Prescottella agglutinans]|uniref:hypothetical protein n=1 Tax=Prescottella agglutinans TaxID=1644129 RepID=UPI003D9526D2